MFFLWFRWGYAWEYFTLDICNRHGVWYLRVLYGQFEVYLQIGDHIISNLHVRGDTILRETSFTILILQPRVLLILRLSLSDKTMLVLLRDIIKYNYNKEDCYYCHKILSLSPLRKQIFAPSCDISNIPSPFDSGTLVRKQTNPVQFIWFILECPGIMLLCLPPNQLKHASDLSTRPRPFHLKKSMLDNKKSNFWYFQWHLIFHRCIYPFFTLFMIVYLC